MLEWFAMLDTKLACESVDVVWYNTIMIPDSFWYRPLNVPGIEVLKFQSAQARLCGC